MLIALTILLIILAWFIPALLGVVSLAMVSLGSFMHDTFSLPQPDEQDAWLFSLLIQITRFPTLVFGLLLMSLSAVLLWYWPTWLIVVRSMCVDLFVLLLFLRIFSILVGSVIYGSSLRSIIKSLQS